ncbi:MAG: type VI secretion system baseplate subunit TssK [Zoogloeaceae bacterium]|jgi:type VI secretion system protein ImpJ|nr:type VI secretion system baseplate subunit TssK [Azoarcus sp.]MDR1646763.1 type VI secretion system baseplate subunit TssK [Zoogloeaceae bacterium]
MSKSRRVLWGGGLFLRPQHFQQQALFIDNAIAETLQSAQRHAWGLARIELDTGALYTGNIRLEALDVVFRDGSRFYAPDKEPVPLSRNLRDVPQVNAETTLYACLPHLNTYGGNTVSGNDSVPSARPARYRNAHRKATDLYTNAIETDITVLELDVRLMLEEENRDGYDSVPIARLAKDATGQWRVVEDYIPPMVTVSASPPLRGAIQRLLDILMAKSVTLSGTQRERARNVMGYSSSDIASFWLLHTVNSNFALFNHLLKAEPLHPEELYLALARLCGELLTFSTIYKLSDLPAYCHDELAKTFPKLDKMVRELLDTVVSTRYVIIPLTMPKPSFHIGRLESTNLIENADFYLSVRGDMPVARIIEEVPAQYKVGSPDDVDKILHSAMPGVNLQPMQQTPTALPVHAGNHYFALEARGDIYKRMLQSRSICIYTPKSLANLEIELIGVFR